MPLHTSPRKENRHLDAHDSHSANSKQAVENSPEHQPSSRKRRNSDKLERQAKKNKTRGKDDSKAEAVSSNSKKRKRSADRDRAQESLRRAKKHKQTQKVSEASSEMASGNLNLRKAEDRNRPLSEKIGFIKTALSSYRSAIAISKNITVKSMLHRLLNALTNLSESKGARRDDFDDAHIQEYRALQVQILELKRNLAQAYAEINSFIAAFNLMRTVADFSKLLPDHNKTLEYLERANQYKVLEEVHAVSLGAAYRRAKRCADRLPSNDPMRNEQDYQIKMFKYLKIAYDLHCGQKSQQQLPFNEARRLLVASIDTLITTAGDSLESVLDKYFNSNNTSLECRELLISQLSIRKQDKLALQYCKGMEQELAQAAPKAHNSLRLRLKTIREELHKVDKEQNRKLTINDKEPTSDNSKKAKHPSEKESLREEHELDKVIPTVKNSIIPAITTAAPLEMLSHPPHSPKASTHVEVISKNEPDPAKFSEVAEKPLPEGLESVQASIVPEKQDLEERESIKASIADAKQPRAELEITKTSISPEKQASAKLESTKTTKVAEEHPPKPRENIKARKVVTKKFRVRQESANTHGDSSRDKDSRKKDLKQNNAKKEQPRKDRERTKTTREDSKSSRGQERHRDIRDTSSHRRSQEKESRHSLSYSRYSKDKPLDRTDDTLSKNLQNKSSARAPSSNDSREISKERAKDLSHAKLRDKSKERSHPYSSYGASHNKQSERPQKIAERDQRDKSRERSYAYPSYDTSYDRPSERSKEASEQSRRDKSSELASTYSSSDIQERSLDRSESLSRPVREYDRGVSTLRNPLALTDNSALYEFSQLKRRFVLTHLLIERAQDDATYLREAIDGAQELKLYSICGDLMYKHGRINQAANYYDLAYRQSEHELTETQKLRYLSCLRRLQTIERERNQDLALFGSGDSWLTSAPTNRQARELEALRTRPALSAESYFVGPPSLYSRPREVEDGLRYSSLSRSSLQSIHDPLPPINYSALYPSSRIGLAQAPEFLSASSYPQAIRDSFPPLSLGHLTLPPLHPSSYPETSELTSSSSTGHTLINGYTINSSAMSSVPETTDGRVNSSQTSQAPDPVNHEFLDRESLSALTSSYSQNLQLGSILRSSSSPLFFRSPTSLFSSNFSRAENSTQNDVVPRI